MKLHSHLENKSDVLKNKAKLFKKNLFIIINIKNNTMIVVLTIDIYFVKFRYILKYFFFTLKILCLTNLKKINCVSKN